MFNPKLCPCTEEEEKKKIVTLETINPSVKLMENAIRGPVSIRAAEIERELKMGSKKPFKEVIKAHLGDCHSLGQQPVTFLRQVVSLVAYPPLMACSDFPDDAKDRACTILKSCNGNSIGSYSDSCGIPVIRKHVAEFIQRRDEGVPSLPEDVIMTTGASGGARAILELLASHVDCKKPGIMVPIPLYPLYSSYIAEFDMAQIGYQLNECNNWALDMSELNRAITEAKSNEIIPRGIVVINPGNPTGQVLSRDNVEEIIKFAFKEKLMILTDEVYQFNVYVEGCKFHSFKKCLRELGPPFDRLELASLMSTSKGFTAECGLRGGYMEVINLDPDVKTVLVKSLSASLCPTTIGQTAMDVVVNPPKKNEPSYCQFMKERHCILCSLCERAKLVADTFNCFEGFSCNKVQGALYAFPRIKLPQRAIEAAQKAGLKPDEFYAYELLEKTGICVVPGTGFGQKPGTYHFRTTILPQPDKLKFMLDRFGEYQKQFLAEYGDSAQDAC